MKELLNTLRDDKLLRNIDIYFAENICAVFETGGEGLLTFALLFNATEGGDTCLDLSKPEKISFYEQYKVEIDKALSTETINLLRAKNAVCDQPSLDAPFILTGSKLYMKSFYTDEHTVANFTQERVRKTMPVSDLTIELLCRYFVDDNMQKAAALNAAINSFSVISGGPGTGKTTTVFKLLAVLCGSSDHPLRIAVCAPTGKAASRLNESIQEQRSKYADENFIDQIPKKALTVHRLLGMFGDAKKPKFNKENKLPYDIIIADEASMVDVRMMAKLVEATSDKCRLVLLGDKDQLASVQPGAVLGNICSNAPVNIFTPDRADILSPHAGKTLEKTDNIFADITIMLDRSYRFEATPEIGLLAAASGSGDYESAMEVFENNTNGPVSFIEIDSDFETVLGGLLLEQYKSYSGITDYSEALTKFSKFRILSPHKKNLGGTEHINNIALKTLFRAGLADSTKQFYHGMPLMITENDHSLGLFNGETGLIFGNKDQKACFAVDKDTIRHITPARLPGHVPAYAMTVHKSQGSEFEHVVFVLPESDSQILTRELFYTAVTRAISRLTVISTKNAVKKCLTGKIERSSGLNLSSF